MAQLPVSNGLSEPAYIFVLSLCRAFRLSSRQQKHYNNFCLDILVVPVDYVYGTVRLSHLVHTVPVSVFWRVVSAWSFNQGPVR